MVNNIWQPYPKLRRSLEETQAFVLSKVDVRNKEIADLIADLVKAGGKMTRPAFFYLFSEFGDSKVDLVEGSATLEILHLATLIHDDVIDNSPLRRGAQTIHTKYGMRNAIYAGDLLFTIYFELLTQIAPNRTDILMNSRSMHRILLGELDQMLINDNPDATVKMYLREISGKTAELFSLSAIFGAVMGKADESIIKKAKYIGHDIGMAFQIIDDLLDYSTSKKTGKPVLEDLSNKIYSLPIILALKNDSGELRELLEEEVLNNEQKKRAVELIEQNNGLVETKKIADHYTIRALDRIKTLPDNEAKKILINITKQMLKRGK
ncbi:geranylgeranyl pyrophosphate synthase [Companilactobacillus sp. RD055328]|uniref:polyprenyl synthetase family protein n=1 Tax=Companilactobacillus sp. RD055328 TaxID=2916634 RepID=UPI001FC7F45E|nr:polyprenyl synthetase family protein [Companilactobacillus sp. RD055328]GKQ43421.1 geranylgeranyl pyrophosphate synthase [Companilactobacillus sp. RD055328]